LRRDFVCAALGLALAVVYWIAANALPQSFLSDAVGADGLPKAYAVVLAVLSGLIAAQAFWRKPAASEDRQHFRALGIAALGFLYTVGAAFVGYTVSVIVVTGVAAWYYGARRPLTVGVFAIASGAFLWFMFAYVLNVAMP
jgi:putative tricarboxylic transport membrane protein